MQFSATLPHSHPAFTGLPRGENAPVALVLRLPELSCSAAQLLSCSAELRRCVAAAWLLGFSRPRPHSASRAAPPKLSPPPIGPASRPAHRREGPAEVTRRIGVRPLRGTPGDRGSSELKTKVRTSEN